MTLRYSVTPEDYGRFGVWHYDNMPQTKQQVKRIVAGMSVFVVTILGLMALGSPRTAPFTLLIMLGFLAFVIWVFPKRHRQQVQKQYLKLYSSEENAGLFGNHSLEISAEGVMSTSENRTSLTRWQMIDQIVESDNHAYLLIGTVMGLIINRDTVTEGNFDDFVAEARRLHAEATGTKTPVPIPAR